MSTSAAERSSASNAAHPLLYASLTPVEADSGLPCINLYKPKAEYTIGRNPQSDFVLDCEYFEWSICNIVWDGRDEVRIVDLCPVNGIWVNRRRLTPGSSRILRDGDTVFFSVCILQRPRDGRSPPIPCYVNNEDHAFTYHQYTDCPPPLSTDNQGIWTRLDRLEQSCRRIDDEIARLRREKEGKMMERQTIASVETLPECPPFVRSIYADDLQRTWDAWDDIRKGEDPSIILPDDFRELCRPSTDDVAYDSYWRDMHQTVTRYHEIPPPLDWEAPMGSFTEVYHRPGWPDWNNPDLQRRELGLPPLEDPPIVRPRGVMYSLNCLWCPDEDVLAEKVTQLLPTLRPDDERLPPLKHETSSGPENVADTVTPLKEPPIASTNLRGDKRKREDDDVGEDEDRASLAPSTPHLPVAEGDRSPDTSTPSTKRKKTNASPSPHSHTDVPIASLSESAATYLTRLVPVRLREKHDATLHVS
ncbi:hypothetical protein PENSPDRAFT_667672 [Peniophora sp. CONT]|nr:hypothetical protein PENSPDRAFT_667672 [Peniophora sp. CONT]